MPNIWDTPVGIPANKSIGQLRVYTVWSWPLLFGNIIEMKSIFVEFLDV